MTIREVDLLIIGIKKEVKALAKKGKRTFLFVYCAGHGVADQRQYMVFNAATSGNLFSIEQTLRDICLASSNMCTVFAVYDMCKDIIGRYPELTKMAIKVKKGKTKGRGIGEATKLGVPYWQMSGAESLGVVDAESCLAMEMLDRLQSRGEDGVIEFPTEWTDFVHGKLEHALGALSFNASWVRLVSDITDCFYLTIFFLFSFKNALNQMKTRSYTAAQNTRRNWEREYSRKKKFSTLKISQKQNLNYSPNQRNGSHKTWTQMKMIFSKLNPNKRCRKNILVNV